MEVNYKKIPGVGTSASNLSGMKHVLLQGDDHLLLAEIYHSEERYRRFYYRDIQLIIASRNKARLIGNLIISTIMCFIAGTFLLVFKSTELDNLSTLYAELIVISPFVVGMLINWWRGPTCNAYIVTAGSAVKIPPLSRIKKVNRLLDSLRPIIESAQSELATKAEQIDRQQSETHTAPISVHAQTLGLIDKNRKKNTPPLRHCTGRVHLALFIFTLLNALHSAASLMIHNAFIKSLAGYFMIGFIILTIWSFISQRRSDLHPVLKRCLYFYTTYLVLSFTVFFSYGFVLLISGQPTGMDSTNSDFIFYDLILDTIVSLLFGLFGLIAYNRYMNKATTSQSLPANDQPSAMPPPLKPAPGLRPSDLPLPIPVETRQDRESSP